MRPLLLMISLFTAVAFACQGTPQAKGCGSQPSVPLIEPISYALEQMKLQDNADIRTAIRMYKKEVRSLSQMPAIPTVAFQGGSFNPGAYALNSPDAQMLKAQIDLFDTIFLILNDEQKKEFPVLIGIYQHHMKFTDCHGKCCGGSNGCGTPAKGDCGPKACPSPKKGSQPILKR